MQFNQSVIELIKKRRSVRTFSAKDIDTKNIENINHLLDQHKTGPFGNNMNFSLIKKEFASGSQKVKIGTYGFITGAQYFIAGEIKDSNYCFEDYGYVLEKIILHLTSMNLGTCWLGGTFNRKILYGALQSDKDELIPAITPVGYIAESKNIRENIIRWVANSNQRFEWEKLFLEGEFSSPLTRNNANEFVLPLEMVRLAPSASNKQPWRILKKDGVFHFYLKRTPGYDKAFKNVDLQRVDMGIAMAHFELVCNELKLNGSWENLKSQLLISNDMEYLISWKI